MHDGTYAYFLFVWDDPTRSLKQLPLKKTAKGWRLLHDGFEYGDERPYNEDKFAVLFTRLDAVLAGDLTFHAGPEPVAGKPRNEATADMAGKMAVEGAQTLRYNGYKVPLMRNLVKRAIRGSEGGQWTS